MTEIEKVKKYTKWRSEVIELNINKYKIIFSPDFSYNTNKYIELKDVEKLYTIPSINDEKLTDYIVVLTKMEYYLAFGLTKDSDEILCFCKFDTLKQACEGM